MRKTFFRKKNPWMETWLLAAGYHSSFERCSPNQIQGPKCNYFISIF